MGTRTRGLSLRLFVAGESPDATIAIANLEALFPHGKGEVEIEVVDVQRDPARAARDRIMLTPTLLKLSPPPACRILGNLKNRDALLRLLGIDAAMPEGEGLV